MSLLDTLADLVKRDAKRYQYVAIPPDHVTDGHSDPAPLEGGKHYFQLWLAEMSLRRDIDWFRRFHPAAHSAVRLQFGSQKVELPSIAGELRLSGVDESNLDKSVQLNYPLTGLLPFNGGVVELAAGLMAVPGTNYVASLFTMAGDLASLLVQPQLSAALSIAGPVATGVQGLLAGGGLHLGLHQAFTGKNAGGANELRAGYLAVVLAEERQVSADRLWVKAGRLRIGDSAANNAPFGGYAYMLFRIDKRTDRDDWRGITSIFEPFNTALSALGTREPDRAESFRRIAVTAALQSIDLTEADQGRIARALNDRFKEAQGLGLGAAADHITFEEVIQRAISPEQSLAQGKPSFGELFGSP